VTLHANSIAGALYKNKFESSETPTITVRSQCQLQCLLPAKRWPNQKSLQISAKYQQWWWVSGVG